MAQSEGYRGPHVFFTPEELRFIYERIVVSSDAMAQSITKKIEVAYNTDPKFRVPMD